MTTSLGNVGEEKIIQYQIGKCLFKKKVVITEKGYEVIRGTELFIEESSSHCETSLEDLRERRRNHHLCPA